MLITTVQKYIVDTMKVMPYRVRQTKEKWRALMLPKKKNRYY